MPEAEYSKAYYVQNPYDLAPLAELREIRHELLIRISKARLRPVTSAEELACLWGRRNFGIFSGFAVIPNQAQFGVHVEYTQGERRPIFTLTLIDPEVLCQMSDGVRTRIITTLKDARAGNFSVDKSGFALRDEHRQAA